MLRIEEKKPVEQPKKLAPVKPPPITVNSLISGSGGPPGRQIQLNTKR